MCLSVTSLFCNFRSCDRCPPSKSWIEIATDLKELTFTLTNYKSEKDYMFRVRASNDYGVSDPSPSATLFAPSGVYTIPCPCCTHSWRFCMFLLFFCGMSAASTIVSGRRNSVDIQKAKVKPRTVWEKPELSEISEKSCTLTWKPSSIPDYAAQVPIHRSQIHI